MKTDKKEKTNETSSVFYFLLPLDSFCFSWTEA